MHWWRKELTPAGKRQEGKMPEHIYQMDNFDILDHLKIEVDNCPSSDQFMLALRDFFLQPFQRRANRNWVPTMVDMGSEA